MKIAFVHKNSAIYQHRIACRGTKCYFCECKVYGIYEEKKSKRAPGGSRDR